MKYPKLRRKKQPLVLHIVIPSERNVELHEAKSGLVTTWCGETRTPLDKPDEYVFCGECVENMTDFVATGMFTLERLHEMLGHQHDLLTITKSLARDPRDDLRNLDAAIRGEYVIDDEDDRDGGEQFG